jgi:acyl-CoA oxidase
MRKPAIGLAANETADIVIDGQQYNTFTEPPVALAAERHQTTFPVREMTVSFILF